MLIPCLAKYKLKLSLRGIDETHYLQNIRTPHCLSEYPCTFPRHGYLHHCTSKHWIAITITTKSSKSAGGSNVDTRNRNCWNLEQHMRWRNAVSEVALLGGGLSRGGKAGKEMGVDQVLALSLFDSLLSPTPPSHLYPPITYQALSHPHFFSSLLPATK